jgi:hypothetical protein
MKFFHAKSQRRKDLLRSCFASLRLCGGKFLAITIALSFIAMLVPIASASRDKSNTMPCCVGKSAGHCDSGITPKPPQPKSEPMCGLDNTDSEDDGITIVAEPAHTETHQTHKSAPSGHAAESASLSPPCHMDCGACATASTRQQKRDRGILQATTDQSSPLTAGSIYEDLTVLFSVNENWEQTSPRGPPTYLR